MTKLEVRRIDGQLAVIIPADLAARLGLEEGAAVSLAPVEPPSETELMRLAEDIMEHRKQALAALAR